MSQASLLARRRAGFLRTSRGRWASPRAGRCEGQACVLRGARLWGAKQRRCPATRVFLAGRESSLAVSRVAATCASDTVKPQY